MTFLLTCIVKVLLWLRYRVVIRGRREVASRGRRGILFLPNHPALVDPIILMAGLRRPFAPRALADRDQVNRFFIRTLARRVGVVGIPYVDKEGAAGAAGVAHGIDEVLAALRRGENMLLYPAGQRGGTGETFPPPEPEPGKSPEPVLAVEAGGEAEHPEIVLGSTQPVGREEANRFLRQEGLSPLNNIRRVVQVDRIPLLGTGKTDYRTLREIIGAH